MRLGWAFVEGWAKIFGLGHEIRLWALFGATTNPLRVPTPSKTLRGRERTLRLMMTAEHVLPYTFGLREFSPTVGLHHTTTLDFDLPRFSNTVFGQRARVEDKIWATAQYTGLFSSNRCYCTWSAKK